MPLRAGGVCPREWLRGPRRSELQRDRAAVEDYLAGRAPAGITAYVVKPTAEPRLEPSC
jgi:hypothetical protein